MGVGGGERVHEKECTRESARERECKKEIAKKRVHERERDRVGARECA
jgi:hypothetical protein